MNYKWELSALLEQMTTMLITSTSQLHYCLWSYLYMVEEKPEQKLIPCLKNNNICFSYWQCSSSRTCLQTNSQVRVFFLRKAPIINRFLCLARFSNHLYNQLWAHSSKFMVPNIYRKNSSMQHKMLSASKKTQKIGQFQEVSDDIRWYPINGVKFLNILTNAVCKKNSTSCNS